MRVMLNGFIVQLITSALRKLQTDEWHTQHPIANYSQVPICCSVIMNVLQTV